MSRIRAASPGNMQFRTTDPRDTLTQKLEVLRRAAAELEENGTYTPTFEMVTNVAAIAALGECVWFKRGNTIYVQGMCSVDPTTAAIETLYRISIPVPTNFTATQQGRGVGTISASSGQAGLAISASASADAMTVRYFPVTNGNVTHIFSFSYELA